MAKAQMQAIGLLAALVAAGCATQATAPQTGGVAIAFAALEGSQACSTTWNGTGTLPSAGADAIDRLTLVWTAQDTGKSARAQVSAAEVASNGTWNVGALPASEKLRVQVYACTADKRVVWYGEGNDFVVTAGEETTARVFMTPPGKLACTGSGGTGGALQSPRAFLGGTALASGDVIVVGGADKWDGTLAKASVATDIYDYKLGRWRAGPALAAARIWPQVLALDATHVLVTGGSPRLQQTNNTLPISIFAPFDLAAASAPSPPAEVVEVAASASTAAASPADVGSGARPFANAAIAGDAIVFAGGLGVDGKALATGARVRGLAALAALGGGTTEALSLTTPRVQPIVLSYADGTAVIWGGQTTGKASDLGEIVAASATAGAALTVSGADITADPNAAVMGAAAVILREEGDRLTFFVTGGIAVDAGWATATPNYIVVVDRAAKTAECKKVTLSGETVLPGGIGIAATLLDGGYILVSGGLLALGKLPAADDPMSLCQTDEKTKNGCMANGLVLLAPPTDWTAPTVALTAVPVETLGPPTPRFGQIALPLPVGALLAGGMHTAVGLPASATQTFDAAAQIVSAPFLPAANQASCAP